MKLTNLIILFILSLGLCESKKRADPNHFMSLKIPLSKIKEMKSKFELQGGLVLRPSDPLYKDYMKPWNLKCRDRPSLVFLPNTPGQAAEALNIVKKFDESFVIMSGGHDYQCESNTDRILINLALFNKVQVDESKQVAILGSGARWGDIYKVLQPLGYDIPGGQCPKVGVGGYLLGTGFNWLLSRFYGSGAENTVEVKAVLADGSIETINWENQYKDLMWGLMGAGGEQFALVLQFTVKIHKQPTGGYHVTFITYKFEQGSQPQGAGEYALADLKPIYKEWISTMKSMQDDQSIGGNTLILARNLTNLERREYRLAFAGFCRGDQCNWAQKLNNILQKFPANVRHLGTRSTFFEFGIIGQIVPLVDGYPMTKYHCSQPSALFDDYSHQMVDNIIDFFIPAQGDTPASKLYYVFETVSFKGSVKDKSKTSFAFPDAPWKTSLVILQQSKVDSRVVEWGKNKYYKTISKSLQNGKYGVYLNYIDHSVQNWQDLYFSQNYKRLQKIKTFYDPEDVFKRNYVAIETKGKPQRNEDL